MHNSATTWFCAVPAHPVNRCRGPALLQHDTHGVGKPYGIVRRIGWQQKHVTFADDNVAKSAIVDDLEHHGTFMLEEPLGRLVDVVVGAGVGAADNLVSVSS